MEYTELRKKGVYLGRAGEDGKRTVWLDVTAWNEQAGGGSGVLLYTSPKGQVWPLGTKTETDETTGTVKLSAPITLAETAAAGIGHIEAQWMSGGEKVKSQTFNTLVLESAYTGETVPDTAPHWVKELIEELNAAGMLLEELGEVASEAHGAYEEIRGTSALIEQALNTAEQTVAQAKEYAEAAQGHAANADNYKTAAAASATAAAASAEQAMDATPDGYAAFVASMAGAYSAASGYAVGDYVLKDGQLYKCNTAIDEEGETWTAAHWTAVTAAGQLSQLSEEIDSLMNKTAITWKTSSDYQTGWRTGYFTKGVGEEYGITVSTNYIRAVYLIRESDFEIIPKKFSFAPPTGYAIVVKAIDATTNIITAVYGSADTANVTLEINHTPGTMYGVYLGKFNGEAATYAPDATFINQIKAYAYIPMTLNNFMIAEGESWEG